MKTDKLMASLLIVAGGLALTGCNDLEQAPSNKYTDANFWTAKNAELMVMTAYSQMYNAGTMWGDEELTDNLYSGYRAEDRHTLRRGIALSNLGLFNWNDWYGGIKSAHVFLANADNISGMDEAKVRRLKAEASFIRDIIFFRLAQLYGDLPFFMADPTLEQASTMSRTPYVEVMKTLKADVEAILPDLPTKSELPGNERGRITQGAAAMLLARMEMMDGNWSEVEKWCRNIMNGEYGSYSLFPDYAGLFAEENEYNDEVILDRGYVLGGNTWGEINTMKPPTLRSATVTWTPTQSLVDCYMTINGYMPDEEGSDFDAMRPYSNRDPRLGATVVYDCSELYDPSTGETHTIHINPANGESDDNIGTGTGLYKTVTGYYTRKWFSPLPDDTGYSSGLNIIMMRYADVLLMYAEAANEQGKLTSEIWNETIRPIRERAGFTAPKALDMPSGDLKQTLRNERRVELALEGLRWWDIKRWKAGKEYLDGPVKGCTYFAGGASVLDTYSFDENRDYLWAVPLYEIDFNSNLKPQNPGYGS